MDYETRQAALADALADPAGFDFNELALALFRYQVRANAPYRSYCQSLSLEPSSLDHWHDIPALPCDAFKFTPPVFCESPSFSTRHFQSSGTTSERKSIHHFRETESYAKAITAGWAHARLPEHLPRFFVFPPPDTKPESSLGFMFETLAGGARDCWLMDEGGLLDPRPLLNPKGPLLLFATALGLLQLLTTHPEIPALPEGSWVFQTGGYKGLDRDSDPQSLHTLIEERLAVPAERVINEYGMTELSSQAYAIGATTPHQCPPWLRFRIIDPETGLEQASGEDGYLCLYDLANLGSVLAIRTQDIACRVSGSSFLLRGRDPHALPRGCSRSTLHLSASLG